VARKIAAPVRKATKRGAASTRGKGASGGAAAKARATGPSDVKGTLAALEALGTTRDREGLARYGIVAPKAYGVPMGKIQALAKQIGPNHDLALALWDTGWYEARLLTAYIEEPERVTSAQMDRWCRDFDNWAVVDTLCFKLFDRTPHAWAKVTQWAARPGEFEKRAAFALLASLAGHDKTSGDEPFLDGLRLIEEAANDDRNFVKKGVNWALRRIGTRNATLRAAAIETATRLASSSQPSARWNGKDALRELKKRPAHRFAPASVIRRA
jgi:3-methyladenine DNA glycosylase AlkD